jgi:hypothetical protein
MFYEKAAGGNVTNKNGGFGALKSRSSAKKD